MKLDWFRRHTAVSTALLFAFFTLLFMSRVLWPAAGQAIGGLDVRGLFYPWLSFARDAVWNGRLPLWDASQFAGYPFLSNPQVALFYPPTWLAILLPVAAGISWYVALHIWLAGLGMYLFARDQSGSRLGALLAGLTFAFSGFMTARIFAGHIGLLAVHSWLPWLLWLTAWSVRNGRFWAGIIAGLPFGLAILAGHTTSLLYVSLIWLAFVLYLAVQTGQWRLVARQTILAGIAGLALSGIQTAPLIQFSLESSRASAPSLEFASAYSFPPAHLITLLIPDYFGEPTRAGYWSVPNFEELTYYAGMLALLGLALALRKPSRRTWFYLIVGVVGLLLAFGSYGFLFPLAYKFLPPFRLTRAPGRAAFLFTFAAAALLAEGVAVWEREPAREELGRLLRWLVGGTAVALIAALAATGAVFAAQHPTDTSGRLWHQLGGWGLALLLVLIGGGLLWRYFTDDSSRRWTGAALVILLLADLWLFGFKLVRLESMAAAPMWPDAKTIIGETEARVLPWGVSIFEQNGAGQVGLDSVFGYNALEVGANVAFTESIPDPRSTAYDILGAGYVVAGGPLEQYGDGERPLTLLDHTDNVWVYQRGRVIPIARLVSQVEVIADDAQTIARVHQPDFDPATTVILTEPPACDLPDTPATGTAQIIEKRDGYWRITTDSPQPALLVLSETDYPGWRATVGGEEVEIMEAYTAVRAICVPAGQQTIEFIYAPTIYLIGGLFTILALLLLGLAVAKLRHSILSS
ncbi:MAG: hypothetical protein H6667_20270 [Ardenticatenaceae bacterium]|nr:hypothetical protein [Ardenticatenaceae bacterium]MCB9446292.1 hypothetical protein [Ardenticatenaceae bacterium]